MAKDDAQTLCERLFSTFLGPLVSGGTLRPGKPFGASAIKLFAGPYAGRDGARSHLIGMPAWVCKGRQCLTRAAASSIPRGNPAWGLLRAGPSLHGQGLPAKGSRTNQTDKKTSRGRMRSTRMDRTKG